MPESSSPNEGLSFIVRSQFSSYRNIPLRELKDSPNYTDFAEAVARMYTEGKRASYIRGKSHLAKVLGYSTHSVGSVLKDAKEQGFEVSPYKMNERRAEQLLNDYNTKTDASAKDIAKEYGISTSYLYRVLKKQEQAGKTVNYRRRKEANFQGLEQSLEHDEPNPPEPQTAILSQYRARRRWVLERLGLAGNTRRYEGDQFVPPRTKIAGRGYVIALIAAAIAALMGSSYMVGRGNKAKSDAEMEALKSLQAQQIQTLTEEGDHWHNKYENAVTIGQQNADKYVEAAQERNALLREKQESLREGREQLEEKELVRILGSDPILGNIPQTLERVTYDTETGELKRERFEYTGPTIPKSFEDVKNQLLHLSSVWEPSHPELVEGAFGDFLKRNRVYGDAAKKCAEAFSDPINGSFRYDAAVSAAMLLGRDGGIITEKPTKDGVKKGLIASPEQVAEWVELVKNRK